MNKKETNFLKERVNGNLKLVNRFEQEILSHEKEAQSLLGLVKAKKKADNSKPEDIKEELLRLKKLQTEAHFLDLSIKNLISRVAEASLMATTFGVDLELSEENKKHVDAILEGTKNFYAVENDKVIPTSPETVAQYEAEFERQFNDKDILQKSYDSIK